MEILIWGQIGICLNNSDHVPSIGDDYISAVDCFPWVMTPMYIFIASKLRDAIPNGLGALISLLWWHAYTHLMSEAREGNEHVVQYVGAISKPGDCEGLQWRKDSLISTLFRTPWFKKVTMLM